MATKAKKKNPRWIVVLEDSWANDLDPDRGGKATKAELLDMLDDMFGFNVIKVSKQAEAK